MFSSFYDHQSVLVIVIKGSLNQGDSKYTISLVFVKSRNWFAFLLLLEDCMRSLGVRLVQISNNNENHSRDVMGLDVALVDNGEQVYNIVFVIFLHLNYSLSFKGHTLISGKIKT